ncbi:MAG: thioredoxin family protein, partial [Chloroflexi bacterium]|nr:thioredoxin family protein [Chloroflexota bacterium]
MWQTLRTELAPKGLEIVTVALDTNADAARAVIEQNVPDHPSLIDSSHTLDALLGVVNVPSGVWIDEEGIIVRPPEPAFPQVSPLRDAPIPDSLPDRVREMLTEAKKIQADPERYVAALRDWAERGADSPFALSQNDVVERSRPRPIAEAKAAAHFELGAHLRGLGDEAGAVRHWRESHRLQPDNGT